VLSFRGTEGLLRGGGERSDSKLSDDLRCRRLCVSRGSGEGEVAGLAKFDCEGMAMEQSLDSSFGLSGR